MKNLFLLAMLLITPSLHAETPESSPSAALILQKGGMGEGRVCLSFDGTGDCPIDDAGNTTNATPGEFVYLRAIAEPGSKFDRWYGDCKSKDRTCKLLVKPTPTGKPITATAIFKELNGKSKKTRARKKTVKNN
jgi:hypothetical protein